MRHMLLLLLLSLLLGCASSGRFLLLSTHRRT
jgi:hypothetical protein